MIVDASVFEDTKILPVSAFGIVNFPNSLSSSCPFENSSSEEYSYMISCTSGENDDIIADAILASFLSTPSDINLFSTA